MMASIVLLNYNDSKRIINLCRQFCLYDWVYNIVVVDNCSLDDDRLFLMNNIPDNKKIVLLLQSENKGYSAGHNAGFRYIKEFCQTPEYIFVVNSDVIITEDAMLACINYHIYNETFGLISVIMKDADGNYDKIGAWKYPTFIQEIMYCFFIGRRLKYISSSVEMDSIGTNKLIECDCVRGSLQCFKSNALYEMGLFDENVFLYNEENIISKRLHKINYKVGYICNYFYIHNHKKNSYTNTKRFKQSLDSSYYYCKEYENYNFVKRVILRISQYCGVFEHFFIDAFFKIQKMFKSKRVK